MIATRRLAGRAGQLASAAGVALLWSCADLLHEPAPDADRPLAIRLTEAPTPARASIAAAGADAARIVVEHTTDSPPAELVVDTVLPLPTDGEAARLRLTLNAALIGANLGVRVELLAGSAVVFRGAASTTLREAGTTVVDLPIEPIVAAVRLGDDPPALQSLGEAIELTGEALFASGEVIPGVSLAWRALDEGVVEVTGTGQATAIGEGEARVEGSYEGRADTLRMVVAQVVTRLEVEPAEATLLPGQQVAFTATARDANDRVAAGRAPIWSSSAPSVISVDSETGNAQGRAAGSAQITATLGDVSAAATVAVENPGPVVTQLSPSSATAGGAGFDLTVSGSGFVEGSAVRWNGAARQTRRISGSELRATIPASDIASPGAAAVTVANPAPGGGASSAVQFQIVAAPALAVEPTSLAFDMDAGGASPGPRTLRVTNAGGGSLGTVVAEVRYLSGSEWLNIDPASADAPATFTVTLDGGSLAAGEYAATVVIRAGGPGTSAEVPVTLVVRAVVPAAPTDLTITRTDVDAELAWTDRSDSETGFRVERRAGDGAWTMLAETAADIQTYRDPGLTRGERYGYRVRAFNSAGASEPTNEVEVIVEDPLTAQTSAATGVGPGGATLNGVTGGNGVDHEVWFVWREVGGTSVETPRASSAPRCGADEECGWSWTLGNLYGGRGYEFWIVAVSDEGTVTGDTVRFETAPSTLPVVEAVTEQLVGRNGARLDYRVIPGGEDFSNWLEIGRQADMEQVELRSDEVQQTLSTRAGSVDPWTFTVTVTGLRRNTNYYWRGAARTASGEVIYSETRRFNSSQGGDGDDEEDDDD